MLRKSKLDTSEKQMLVKEIKLSKAKRKQAELETERWKCNRYISFTHWYENPEFRNESDEYSFKENGELDMKQLEGWVRSEAERYAAVIEQRHHLEIDAFIEQLRLKDEKLETYRWRLLSMEIESKADRLPS
ncbi:hypothetical protein M0R45_038223 [Rubus argutus]|uniref:Uncharacterized protein n=1 Tax=Rubus argutus TaxID=59490 RepID=A0AAW1W1R4_RUBAR